MTDNNLNRLLQTIKEDKSKVLQGLREQDQDRTYKTSEVIAILELSFALVETSVMTEMNKRKKQDKSENPTHTTRAGGVTKYI